MDVLMAQANRADTTLVSKAAMVKHHNKRHLNKVDTAKRQRNKHHSTQRHKALISHKAVTVRLLSKHHNKQRHRLNHNLSAAGEMHHNKLLLKQRLSNALHSRNVHLNNKHQKHQRKSHNKRQTLTTLMTTFRFNQIVS